MTVVFVRLPVAAGNDWWVVMFVCSFRHARPRPGISYNCAPPVEDGLWKECLQNRRVHPKHSSELLVGGVVVKVHAAGGVDLLLCTELRWCLD